MKKSILFILLQALMMLCGTVRADDSVVIGTGTSSTPWLPFYDTGGSGNAHGATQSIYTADEIGRTGVISQIAYNVVRADPQPTLNVMVYMGLTSKDTFVQYDDGISQSNLTLVYSGSPTIASTLGWETIALQTPFHYDGSQNLVIAIFRVMAYTLEGHMSDYACSSSSHLSLYRNGSSSYYSSVSSTGNYWLSTTDRSRADIRIDFEYDGVEFISEGVKYKATSDETVKVVGNSYSGIVKVPSTVTHNGKTYAVKEIGAYAFQKCTSLSYVLLNNGIETIGANAFSGCTSLSSISIPASVTSIGEGAFGGCALLSSMSIPASVTSIAGGAFCHCSNLKRVTLDGPVVEKDYTISYNLSGIFGNQVSEYTIGNNATKIGNYAFCGCSDLTELNMLEGIKSIGDYTFSGCSGLTELDIPNGVTAIGKYAFNNCVNLISVDFPNSITVIGASAFSGCEAVSKATYASIESLCKVVFENGTSCPFAYNYGDLYIGETEATDIIIPNTVTSIGDFAFFNCRNITSASIPGSITQIGACAFGNCGTLKKAEFSSIESLCRIKFNESSSNPLCYAKHLFINGSEVKDLVIPNSITSIGPYTFNYCSGLSSISFPNTITSIENKAFYWCEGLRNIDIPSSVVSIGASAFQGCRYVKTLTLGSGISSIGDEAFNNCYSLTTVIIDSPTLVEKTYSSSSNDNLPYLFGSQVTKFIIGDTPTKIGNYAFYNKTGITEIELGKNIKSIGQRSFYGCTGLTSMVLPEGVTSTGNYSFEDCTGLTSLTLPSTLTSLGSYNFDGCDNLSNVYAYYVTPPSLPYSAFSTYGTLHVYKQMASKYSSQSYWKKFTIVDDIDYQTVTGITFGQPNYTVEVGDLGELSCTVAPSNALLKDVRWSTEDNDIVFVDENTGQFVGLNDGVATIKATSVDYKGYSATVKIYVGNINREEAITLNLTSMDLRVGHTATLSVTQVTNTGSDKPVTWTSSNNNVATVSNGVITGVSIGTATITASIGNGVSASCTVNVTMKKTTLADGSVSIYSNAATDEYDQIIYTRNFSNTKWQSLYVPFTMRYDDWKNDYDVAYINSVRQYDRDGDGSVDETIMDVIYIKAGELYPNMPYLIKAKTTGAKTITLNDATLYQTEINSIECSTMLAQYTFTGTYETIPAATLQANQYYAMGGGALIMTNGTSSLKPFRWYMDITARSAMYNTATDNPQSISIRVVGEENEFETSLYEVAREEEFDNELFNLNGQKIMNHEQLAPGFYIKNGKKIIIR